MSVKDTREEIARDIDGKLSTISQYQQAENSLVNDLNQDLAALKKRYGAKLDPIREKKQAAIDELVAQLTTYRDTLTVGGKKSVSFRHGEVKWKNSPPSLVFDVEDKKLKRLIRQLRGVKQFLVKTESINKVALKKDESFVNKLIKRRAVHFEVKENLTIILPETELSIVSDTFPYRIDVTPAE